MNRCSKGFTLTELLTALVIHSFFILMLGGTFYTLISFGSRSQMTMTARERGQRVINYIDSRVRNTGLGMWNLESSSEIRQYLAPLTANNKVFSRSDLTFPVTITNYYNTDKIDGDITTKDKITHKTEDKKIICGNVLTLLYAQRETRTLSNNDTPILNVKPYCIDVEYNSSNAAEKLKELINQLDSDEFWTLFFTERCTSVMFNKEGAPETKNSLTVYDKYKNEGYSILKAAADTLKRYNPNAGTQIDLVANYEKTINYVSAYPIKYKYLYEREGSYGEFYYSYFGEDKKNNTSVKSYDIRAWGVSRGAGAPFTVDKYSDKKFAKIRSMSNDVKIPAGDELIYLRGVKIFTEGPGENDPDKEINLKIRKLTNEWGQRAPYQSGILEIYAELDTTKSVLTVWVLSSGGRDNITHNKPADWPDSARWREIGDNNDFKYFVTYVSKGTWKLNNLHKNSSTGEIDFKWN